MSYVVTPLALGGLVFAVASCAQTSAGQRYCVDKNNSVVEDRNCDNTNGGGGGFFFLNTTQTGANRGTVLSQDQFEGDRVPAGDSKARANAGISPKGKGVGSTSITRGGLGSSKGSSGS